MTRRQMVVVLVVGAALGVGGAILVPELARSYLPSAMVGGGPGVEGAVLGKERASDRLLVTVETEQGVVLVTFKKRIPEIDLLVQSGDIVTLEVGEYRPFIEDPEIRRVRKPARGNRSRPAPVEAPPMREGADTEDSDTAAADTTAEADTLP